MPSSRGPGTCCDLVMEGPHQLTRQRSSRRPTMGHPRGSLCEDASGMPLGGEAMSDVRVLRVLCIGAPSLRRRGRRRRRYRSRSRSRATDGGVCAAVPRRRLGTRGSVRFVAAKDLGVSRYGSGSKHPGLDGKIAGLVVAARPRACAGHNADAQWLRDGVGLEGLCQAARPLPPLVGQAGLGAGPEQHPRRALRGLAAAPPRH